ncbi:hypothetical protein [Sulfuracidifex tepidarius]|nr:hypothetical protein [Sulfuracidifex tepidarius]
MKDSVAIKVVDGLTFFHKPRFPEIFSCYIMLGFALSQLSR